MDKAFTLMLHIIYLFRHELIGFLLLLFISALPIHLRKYYPKLNLRLYRFAFAIIGSFLAFSYVYYRTSLDENFVSISNHATNQMIIRQVDINDKPLFLGEACLNPKLEGASLNNAQIPCKNNWRVNWYGKVNDLTILIYDPVTKLETRSIIKLQANTGNNCLYKIYHLKNGQFQGGDCEPINKKSEQATMLDN